MNNFEIMISGYLVGEMEDKSDPYDNDDVHELMMNAELDSICIPESDSIKIKDVYIELQNEFNMLSEDEKEAKGYLTKEFKPDETIMKQHYGDVSDELFKVGSNGSFSIVLDFKHTSDIQYSMDSDNGAELIAHGVTLSSLHFMENQHMRQLYLCEDAAGAKDIMDRLQSSDDSIFNEDVKVGWVSWGDDNKKIWPVKESTADTLDSLIYAVDTQGELYKLTNGAAMKVEPLPEEEASASY